jgi:oligopeptide transport system permease protein
VQAARVAGASHARILWTHVLPHLGGVVAVYLTLTLPTVMLYEAFLSFLGLGVEPPDVSWGLLAADALDALNPLATAWWLVLGPALFLGATLLALNVLGDGLRDALDPRLRAARGER